MKESYYFTCKDCIKKYYKNSIHNPGTGRTNLYLFIIYEYICIVIGYVKYCCNGYIFFNSE